MAQPRSCPSLEELCFDTIIENLDMYCNINEMLPIELKERIFSHYTAKITPVPNSSSFAIATYPEDRYRDVQLVNRITCQRVIPLCFAMWSSLDYRFEKVTHIIRPYFYYNRLIKVYYCIIQYTNLSIFYIGYLRNGGCI
jgi:hypothetical protein